MDGYSLIGQRQKSRKDRLQENRRWTQADIKSNHVTGRRKIEEKALLIKKPKLVGTPLK